MMKSPPAEPIVHAESAPPSAADRRRARRKATPRAADARDAPIRSPVHAMHEELLRGHVPAETDDPAMPVVATDSHTPGWITLTLPFLLSAILWIVIVQLLRRVL